jgi:DNA mismatch repair protein MutS2
MYKDRYQSHEKGSIGEIYLRHLTVDEAFLKLDKSLNDAYVAGFSRLRIVHGKGGTGAVRRLVNQVLKKHPLVKSFRPGEYGEGGAGVTVVLLSEK